MWHANHSGKTCEKLSRLLAPPCSYMYHYLLYIHVHVRSSWKWINQKPFNCNDTSINIEQIQAWIVFSYVFAEWFACHIAKVFAILTFQFCMYVWTWMVLRLLWLIIVNFRICYALTWKCHVSKQTKYVIYLWAQLCRYLTILSLYFVRIMEMDSLSGGWCVHEWL